MAHWLFKEEPSHFSFSDLEKSGKTEWNGVANPLARKYLRQVRKGDQIFYYHTGKEKQIVGIMVAVSSAVGNESTGEVTVAVQPIKPLKVPVSLAQIKQESALAGWELTRLPRLSIMPVTAMQWRKVLALAQMPAH